MSPTVGFAVFEFLKGVVPDVLKRILPAEKMSEADRAALEAEIMLKLAAQDWQRVEAEYLDRADARKLAASDIAASNPLGAFLAATVRPAWGYGALALYAGAMINGWAIPAPVASTVELVVMFYFGGRTLEKVAPLVLSQFGKKGK